jgi:Sec-independent protein translocase protein TatA
MDGILGIGFAEMLIIALVLFVVGGPANTVKWARELGRTVRKARTLWQQMMAELEKDLPGTQEAVNTLTELGQSVREITAAPQHMLNDTLRIAELPTSSPEDPSSSAKSATPAVHPAPKAETSANGKRYAAWMPPEEMSKD